MRSFLMMTAVAAGVSILSACVGPIPGYQMSAYRGQPVSAVIAKFGSPTARTVMDDNEVYYWSNIPFISGQTHFCRIWTIVNKQEIITNWGYESCAF
jgi:hypothetical protein